MCAGRGRKIRRIRVAGYVGIAGGINRNIEGCVKASAPKIGHILPGSIGVQLEHEGIASHKPAAIVAPPAAELGLWNRRREHPSASERVVR